MISDPKTVLERIANTQYSVITARGRKEPYTFENLFQIPDKYKVEGLGNDFVDYIKKIQAKGKEIGIMDIAFYFRRQIIGYFFGSGLFNFSTLTLPFLLNLYLSWLAEKDYSVSRGFWLLILILLVSAIMTIAENQINVLIEYNKIQYLSALGVRFFLILNSCSLDTFDAKID